MIWGLWAAVSWIISSYSNSGIEVLFCRTNIHFVRIMVKLMMMKIYVWLVPIAYKTVGDGSGDSPLGAVE